MLFNKPFLEQRLGALSDFIGDIQVFEELSSTNDLALKLAREGALEGTLIVAEHQTKGKGRNGNAWLSTESQNIMFSLIIKPECPVTKLTLFSLLSALAVAQTVEAFCDERCEIKWPNDVLINRKKVCGILNESAIMGQSLAYLVVGMGLNINQIEFEPELESKATSLRAVTGKSYERETVLALLLERFWELYQQFKNGQTAEALKLWKSHCQMLGREIEFLHLGHRKYGVAEAIDENGSLVVSSSGETIRLSQADISKIRY